MKHHYAPQFLLSRWTRADGRLCIVRNFGGRIDRTWRPPSETAFEEDLYTYSDAVPSPERFTVETDFMSPLDSDAARVAKAFVEDAPTTDSNRQIWAKFLAAMKVRTPEGVALMQKIAGKHVDRQLEHSSDPAWTEVLKRPNLDRDLALERIPDTAAGSQVLTDIMSMDWYTVIFSAGSVRLLSSDRPCVYTTGLQKRDDCVIALPLSPDLAFITFYPRSKAERLVRSLSVNQLARAINQSVVGQASERAYCQRQTDAPESFFRKWLDAREVRR
jgi:hypothetical protein